MIITRYLVVRPKLQLSCTVQTTTKNPTTKTAGHRMAANKKGLPEILAARAWGEPVQTPLPIRHFSGKGGAATHAFA
jgi:hypothetical protein